MMLERIKKLLVESEADAWELTETLTEGWEFYFIRHRLDQNRAKKVRHIRVRVYRTTDGRKTIGSASEEIPPTATDTEAEDMIRQLVKRASYVKNPYYTLNAPSGGPLAPAEGKTPDLSSLAEDYLSAVREIEETEDAYLNSCEIFVRVNHVHFLNSEGIDITDVRPDSTLELVVNAKDAFGEIELYRLRDAGVCDKEALKASVAEVMRFGRDRLRAQPMPKLKKADVVFSTAEIREICGFFAGRMSASYKVRGYSDWEIGQPLGEGDVHVSLEALAELPNSSHNALCDAEGARIHDTVMLRDGVPQAFLGNRQFSAGLGLKDSFIPGNYRMSGGAADEEEICAGDYLEAVDFSDFQADPLSGSIGGEVRLAYWHHGGEVTPVTGGSISGNMLTLMRSMKMTKELTRYDNMEVPERIRLSGMSVTGIA